jgi:RNA polymerase sigma factor (sigma-70 family)
MKHDKLMKFPKRFCVDCNRDQYVYAVAHKTFTMYHCERCRAEIVRAGDGHQTNALRRVTGGIDVRSFADSFLNGKPWEILASESPDVLSDEHSMWPARDRDGELQRKIQALKFRVAFEGLTPRQQEIVQAVADFGTQQRAAQKLSIRQETVAVILKRLKKKMNESVYILGAEGEIGTGTI